MTADEPIKRRTFREAGSTWGNAALFWPPDQHKTVMIVATPGPRVGDFFKPIAGEALRITKVTRQRNPRDLYWVEVGDE